MQEILDRYIASTRLFRTSIYLLLQLFEVFIYFLESSVYLLLRFFDLIAHDLIAHSAKVKVGT